MLNADRHPSNGPLALREPAPVRAGAGADIADAFGVDRDGHASFQEFVDQHRHLMSDYIARRMRGDARAVAERRYAGRADSHVAAELVAPLAGGPRATARSTCARR